MRPILIHSKGHALILGVHAEDDGINVAVVSRHAHQIYFSLFDETARVRSFALLFLIA